MDVVVNGNMIPMQKLLNAVRKQEYAIKVQHFILVDDMTYASYTFTETKDMFNGLFKIGDEDCW